MVGVKRPVDAGDERNGKRTKTKTAPVTTKKAKSAPVKKSFAQKSSKKDVMSGKKDKKTSKRKVEEEEDFDDDEDDFDIDDIPDSEADEDEDEDVEMGGPSDDDEEEDVQEEKKQKTKAPAASTKAEPPKSMVTAEFFVPELPGLIIVFVLDVNASRESHAKQKTLLQERKAAKPNADIIARSKQLWERLRRKSHVPLEERKKLIAELFDIIKGRVKDFVFKHDSVRVIQTALKYANIEQRKQIAQELKGHYKELAQSRYAKFLVGKLLVHGDAEVRDLIIPEFSGHVKRLIRHPEGSWILDDVYRTVATKEQRATLLREWYGPEFSIFKDEHTSAELSEILEKNPEKRSPIMHFLHEMINQLVQKRTTGFTMLHDAMLQYFLNTKPGSSEANEFIELLKGDEEGDLLKNLAFTKSGSRVMCLSLAYSNAKDRKLLTRAYRDTIKLMAGDLHAHMVLLAAYEVIDDTKLTSKLIFPELLNQSMEEEARNDELLYQVNDLTARIPVLFPFAGDRVKWLVPEVDQEVLKEIREIRKETSKKEPAVRRQELVKAASPTLLSFIAARAETLLETSFGCQFIAEVLFDADGDKTAALSAVATAAKAKSDMQDSPFFGRLLKSLVQGGRFNTAEKVVEKVQPPLNFHALLYEQIKDEIMTWATGPNTFVVVALTESDEFAKKDELLKTLKKGKKELEQASAESGKDAKKKAGPTSSGAKLLLEKIR
jgi:pumilio family protein 6